MQSQKRKEVFVCMCFLIEAGAVEHVFFTPSPCLAKGVGGYASIRADFNNFN